jgi:hypothetical protein
VRVCSTHAIAPRRVWIAFAVPTNSGRTTRTVPGPTSATSRLTPRSAPTGSRADPPRSRSDDESHHQTGQPDRERELLRYRVLHSYVTALGGLLKADANFGDERVQGLADALASVPYARPQLDVKARLGVAVDPSLWIKRHQNRTLFFGSG